MLNFDFQARRNQARAGMVEWNGIFRLFRFSGILGQSREVHLKFRKEIPENVCSIRSPARNFRNFWSNGKRPTPSSRAVNFHICRHRYQHDQPITRELPAWARGWFFSNFIHKMALLRYAFAVIEFFSSSLFGFLEQKYFCPYFSFLYSSFITFLRQAFCDG